MKISIVTVVFNNRDTIEAAIQSVLAQTHREIELIVTDGGSTDGTREVLARYESSIAILVGERGDGSGRLQTVEKSTNARYYRS